jgi:hypothetical protein
MSDSHTIAKKRAFDGRIIFDHLPKTAGQAVNYWLTSALGRGCVTENSIGGHQDLIQRYGGTHSVISAHVHFDGEGIDPRYRYITCLREPIDRAVSWLYFVLNNHRADQLPKLYEQTQAYVESEGEDCHLDFVANINNPYTTHFSNIIATHKRSDDEMIQDALLAIDQYDVWGLFEELPAFLSDVATLIGLPQTAQVRRVNVTTSRLSVDDLSPAMLARLTELNSADIILYNTLRERWQASREQNLAQIVIPADPPQWEPYYRRAVSSVMGTVWSDAALHSMGINAAVKLSVQLHSNTVKPWINHAEAKIDLSYRWYDSTGNLVALEARRTPLPVAEVHQLQTVQMQLEIVAPNLPGDYQLSIMPVQGYNRWFDALGFASCHYKVHVSDELTLGSYSGADARFSTEIGRRIEGEIFSTQREGFLLFGPYTALQAGQYALRLQGFQSAPTLGAWLDIRWNKAALGTDFYELYPGEEDVIDMTIPFQLNEDVEDLEIRIWVDAEVNISVHQIIIYADLP